MRRVSIDTVRPGTILAKAILGSSGQVLLKKGAVIKSQYLAYLKRLGILNVYIQDRRMEDVTVDDVVKEQTRHEARLLVKQAMNNLRSPSYRKKGINVTDKKIMQSLSKIIDELIDNKETMVQLIDIRSKDDYLFAHCVNCTILALIIAMRMNYGNDSLKHLALGATFHDLGMIAIPGSILCKPGELTEDEYQSVKKHPVYGFELFKNTSLYNGASGAIVLQHHERVSGQGYPLGLEDNRISPLAQIVGIVDVYDALTSDRPYRKAYKPHEAVEMIMSWGGGCFDMKILNNFIAVIAAYPVGCHVVLSNGESGLVIANKPNHTLRPVVRVLYSGEDLALHSSPYDLDLSTELNLTIVKVLD